MLGISLEEFEKQAKCTNASAPADFEKRLDAKRCQHCWTLRHSHLCKGCEKLLCQHCFHYTFCGRGERGDMYHEASSISVNRGGSQANEKAVEKGDGKYDRDDVDKGPAIRQKKGANKINRLMMMNDVQSQTSTTCVPSSGSASSTAPGVTADAEATAWRNTIQEFEQWKKGGWKQIQEKHEFNLKEFDAEAEQAQQAQQAEVEAERGTYFLELTSRLAKQHVSNKNECAPGENSSAALLIVRPMPPKPSRPTPW